MPFSKVYVFFNFNSHLEKRSHREKIFVIFVGKNFRHFSQTKFSLKRYLCKKYLKCIKKDIVPIFLSDCKNDTQYNLIHRLQEQNYCKRSNEFQSDSLPHDIIEKIIIAAASTCINTWPNHVVATFNSIRLVSRFFQIVADAKTGAFLPQVYFSRPDLLPKPVKGKITVNMQRLTRNFGSFSGIVMSLKDIIHHSKYCTSWLVLALIKYSWYIIENIFW